MEVSHRRRGTPNMLHRLLHAAPLVQVTHHGQDPIDDACEHPVPLREHPGETLAPRVPRRGTGLGGDHADIRMPSGSDRPLARARRVRTPSGEQRGDGRVRSRRSDGLVGAMLNCESLLGAAVGSSVYACVQASTEAAPTGFAFFDRWWRAKVLW